MSDDLPIALEQVTRLGQKKLARVLRAPLDPTGWQPGSGSGDSGARSLNAQLRADEQQLKRKTTGDVLERLMRLVEKQEKLIPPPAPTQQAEDRELERSDAEASVMASGGDGSEEGY